jgi:hypothetical protein
MPQVNSLLEQLDQGKSVQELVREEKRRVRKKLDRSTTKHKRLKILEGKKEVGRLSQSFLRMVCGTHYFRLCSGSVFVPTVLLSVGTYIYIGLQRLKVIQVSKQVKSRLSLCFFCLLTT